MLHQLWSWRTRAQEYRKILENSGMIVKMMAGYVDDGRQESTVMEEGMRFSKEERIF